MTVDAWGMSRKRWSVEEKRRIVELTLVPGASVARVAQAEGVNAHQVFLWRRAYRNGEMLPADSTALLPVVIEAEDSRSAEITLNPDVAPAATEQLLPARLRNTRLLPSRSLLPAQLPHILPTDAKAIGQHTATALAALIGFQYPHPQIVPIGSSHPRHRGHFAREIQDQPYSPTLGIATLILL